MLHRGLWSIVAVALTCMASVAMGFPPDVGAAGGVSARVAAQQRELGFLVHELELHPALHDTARSREFEAFATAQLAAAAQPLPDWRIVAIAARLAAWVRNPHTIVYGFAARYPGGRALPVAFAWASDGLVTLRVPGSPAAVQTGDRVLAISGVPVAVVQQRLTDLLAGDAILLRSLGADCLPADSTLHALGLVSPGGQVSLDLQGNVGSMFTVELPLQPNDGDLYEVEHRAMERFDANFDLPEASRQHGHRGTNWAWFANGRYGFFLLTSCVYDASYSAAVTAFFRRVAKLHSPVVVLDLQQNGGGDSDVAIPWLEHLPMRYEQSNIYLGTSHGYAPFLPPLQPTFDGRLYVLQSGRTFSSAMLLDDALTGPGLGVRVGTTIGEATAGYGDVRANVTPVLHVPFQVSEKWIKQIKGKVRTTLLAQIPLPLTVTDIQQGTNPVARWLSTLP